METVDKTECRVCPHRVGASASYLRNVPTEPPLLVLEGCLGPTVVSLTNQVIRMSCVNCYQRIRAALGETVS